VGGADSSPQRFYSLSAQIQREREAYRELLERTQDGTQGAMPAKARFRRRWATAAAELASPAAGAVFCGCGTTLQCGVESHRHDAIDEFVGSLLNRTPFTQASCSP